MGRTKHHQGHRGSCAALLAALLLGGGCATAMSGLPDDPVLGDVALKQRVFELKSGMRMIVQEDHNTEQVMFRFRVGAGGTADPSGKEGIAHLVEHLAFRNKPGGGQVELWDMQERMGAVRNAFTNQDVTEYFTIVHKERLPELMQLEAWRLSHTLDGVTDEMFQVEREVVRNELRQRYETSSMNIPLEVFEQLFPKGHILRRSTVIGSHDTLQAITLDDVKAFVKQNYTPDNITVVVAGDVQPDQIQKELGRWPPELLFGPGGPGGPAIPPRPRVSTLPRDNVPAPVDTTLRKVVAPVLQPQLVIAWSAPGGLRGDAQDFTAQFAGSAIDRAFRFGINIKPKDDIESLGGFPMPMKNATVFIIFATLRPGADPEKQRTRILDAIAGAWSGDMADFERFFTTVGKWATATRTLRVSSNFQASAGDVLDYYWQTGNPAVYKASLEGVARVDSTEVKRLIFDYLERKRAVSVYFEPEADVLGKGGKKDEQRNQQLERSRDVTPHRLGKKADISLVGLDPPAIRKITRSPQLASLPRFQLNNGLRFVLVPVPGAPVAEINLRMPGGNVTTEPFGMAAHAFDLSETECPDHGSLFPVGGSLSGWTSSLSTNFAGAVLSGNLINGLAVLGDEVRCRKVHEEAHLQFDKPLEEAQERLDRMRKRVQVQATERFEAELYPDHPYGRAVSEPKELRKVSYATLDAHVKSHLRPDRALALVVGDVSLEKVKPLAEKYLSAWQQGGGGSSTVRAPAAPKVRKVLLFDRPGATQSNFVLGCRVAEVTPESYPAHQLVGDVVEEDLRELRENWGATYGVYAAVDTRSGGVATLTAGGAIETSRTVDGVKKLVDLLAEMADKGPGIRPFTLKRWDRAINWNRQLSSGNARANLVEAAEAFGWDVSMWDNYPENLASTTRAQLADIVKPCIGKEIITIVGDKKILAPQLVAAGLPPVE